MQYYLKTLEEILEAIPTDLENISVVILWNFPKNLKATLEISRRKYEVILRKLSRTRRKISRNYV